MATEANSNSDVLNVLIDTVENGLEARKAKKSDVPDVYRSGMRGNEEPPAVRKAREAREALQKAGMRKGVSPDKVARTQHGRNVESEDGDTKEVKFKASKVSKSKQLATLARENADLKKRIEALEKGGKKKLTIG